MTATIPATATAAAGRARDLAELITERAALHPASEALLKIADLLTTAATSLETTDAPVMDGITVTNTTPAEACFALMDAQAVALGNPNAGISDHVMWYVTAPITRRVPELEQLNPVSTQLARQEVSLRTRIALAAAELETTANEDTRHDVLEALLNLHRMFDRLADSVAVDNNRPCNRR
ncbi:hypothetical protein ABT358_02320 [Streptomyces sp. NPDC000341]|uniref:hypothetical protein n=1 Tax=Streptomyces sp. NPDC000341 TaxID=3156645 RepID=UPI003333E900